jgi:hypothetical protein
LQQNRDSIYSKILNYFGSSNVSGSNDDEIIAKTARALGLTFADASSAIGALKTHRLILRDTSSSLNLADNTSRTIVHFSVAKQEIENNRKTNKPIGSANVKNADRVDSREIQDILTGRTRAGSQDSFNTSRDRNVENMIRNPQRSNYGSSGIFVNEDGVKRIRRAGQAGADRAGTW